jgi:hypothetical protein
LECEEILPLLVEGNIAGEFTEVFLFKGKLVSSYGRQVLFPSEKDDSGRFRD